MNRRPIDIHPVKELFLRVPETSYSKRAHISLRSAVIVMLLGVDTSTGETYQECGYGTYLHQGSFDRR